MNDQTQLLQPTNDLDLAKRQIDEQGYTLIADALTPEQLTAARTRLVEQATAELEQGFAFEDGGAKQQWGAFRDEEGNLRAPAFTAAAGGVNQRVWMLINKGRIFRELLLIERVRAVVDHVLGDDYLLSSFTANIAKPGGVPMNLHTDQWWMPHPIERAPSPVPIGSMTREKPNLVGDEPPAMIAACVCVNVMWMLNDFSFENGGTHIVPGSHLIGRPPHKDRDKDVPRIAAAGPAGTAMVFDGRIWHGTGANISDGPRLGMLTTFCGPQFRPQENFTVGIRPEVYAELDQDVLDLLGFKIWNAYGRVENPTAGYIEPGSTSLGQLPPAG